MWTLYDGLPYGRQSDVTGLWNDVEGGQMPAAIWIVVGLVVVVVVLVVVLKLVGTAPDKPKLPYEREPSLLTPAERSFMGVLEQVVGDDVRVMAKVRLADIIKVKRGLDASVRTTAQNKINSKHIDFVLCDPGDFSTIAAVELDDSSHARASRQSRDEFIDRALDAAGIRILHFSAKRSYSTQEVRDALAEEQEKAEPLGDHAADADQEPVGEEASARVCPNCSGELVLRTASKGENAGQQFWGCSNYPKCRTTFPVESSGSGDSGASRRQAGRWLPMGPAQEHARPQAG